MKTTKVHLYIMGIGVAFASMTALDIRDANAAFSGMISRSLCGAAGQPLNPLVAAGVYWTVPATLDQQFCQVNQTSLDPSTTQQWLINFPVERRATSSTSVIPWARVFGGAFPNKQVCAKTVTYNSSGSVFSDSLYTCTIGSPSNQSLAMTPVSLPTRGALVMKFYAFGGATIYKGEISYITDGT